MNYAINILYLFITENTTLCFLISLIYISAQQHVWCYTKDILNLIIQDEQNRISYFFRRCVKHDIWSLLEKNAHISSKCLFFFMSHITQLLMYSIRPSVALVLEASNHHIT